ncbi:hypothetical protein AO384_0496 [Moraxella catarrhalis]|uniref:Uncharacterized protein n=1 Tax=Moraxella catarrhalis TaxID=480 RepID=A0A198UN94_MORCA|nr:hypothetical protein AO384_0496 [Moraxella catarrhalis]OAU99382.1 hypothetical protein AO382_2027 [Moraxella catarrhalis]
MLASIQPDKCYTFLKLFAKIEKIDQFLCNLATNIHLPTPIKLGKIALYMNHYNLNLRALK